MLLANRMREKEDERVSNQRGGTVWNSGLIDLFAVALSQPSSDLSGPLSTLKAQMDQLYYRRGKGTAWSVNDTVWAVMKRDVADGPKLWAYYGVV